MIIYKPFEMHSHTRHSDGRFTLEELCDTAKRYGFEGIALTDHNTTAAFDGLPETPVINGIPVIRGIEWTTFFGHMQALYAEKFVDWRWAEPDIIDMYIARLKEVNAVVGIVHPFEVGSPMCTGCFWDFHVRNWDAVDYLEVWSKGSPTKRYETPLALEMWTDLLNRGHRIAVTAGRDWHWDNGREHSAATCIGLEDGIVSAKTVRDAFRCGRTYLTCGPEMDIAVEQDGISHTIGETLHPGPCKMTVSLDRTARRTAWEKFGIMPGEMCVVMNGKVACSADCLYEDHVEMDFSAENGWFRLEIRGDALGESGKQVGLSSAFYCE